MGCGDRNWFTLHFKNDIEDLCMHQYGANSYAFWCLFEVGFFSCWICSDHCFIARLCCMILMVCLVHLESLTFKLAFGRAVM